MIIKKVDGISIKIDEEDLDLLEKHEYKYLRSRKNKRGYFGIMISDPEKKTVSSIMLHREIAERKFSNLDWGNKVCEDPTGKKFPIRIAFKDRNTSNVTRENLLHVAPGLSYQERKKLKLEFKLKKTSKTSKTPEVIKISKKEDKKIF